VTRGGDEALIGAGSEDQHAGPTDDRVESTGTNRALDLDALHLHLTY
jgi:hypothetical protein